MSEPRSWIHPPEIHEVPSELHQWIISGLRNDGQMFAMRQDYDPRYEEKAAVALRKQFDYYLDPRCECVVGKNCEMHQNFLEIH